MRPSGAPPLLAERMLDFDVKGDAIVPRYLTAADESWAQSLLVLVREHAGLPRRRLESRVREALPGSWGALRLATHVALEACVDATPAGPSPALLRRELYAERGRSAASRDEVMSRVAARLGLEPADIERDMFGDLPSGRLVGRLPADMSGRELVLRTNLRLAQGVVARARHAAVAMEGHVRRVVQFATCQGLLCTVRGEDPTRCHVDISGPFAVLGSTSLYGRALASLVPVLPWCGRFRLAASVRLSGRDLRFRLDDAAPIARGAVPRRHDSRIEERFEADMRRLAPDWDVVREPQALRVGETLVFPDFAIGPRSEPDARVLVEIVGWWTRDYVTAKLARLREARCRRLILCIEERIRPGAGAIADLDVITFRRRVDVLPVLARARAVIGG